jgi:hypothetical protein
MRKITKKDLDEALEGFGIEERVEGAGFVYFNGGRVTWTTKATADPVRGEGWPEDFEVELFESWGSPSRPVADAIMRLVSIYVAYNRQEKGVTA